MNNNQLNNKMSEDKEEFLREIDELLGDEESETSLPNYSKTNGQTVDSGTGETCTEMTDVLNGLSVDQELPPKTG